MELKSREPYRYELLILKENVADLERLNCFFSLETFRAIRSGLAEALSFLQAWALQRIDDSERQARTIR